MNAPSCHSAHVITDTDLPAPVRTLAVQQDGLLTAAQARRLDVPAAFVRRILHHGIWQSLEHGVYWVVPHGDPRLRTRVRAAQLSCGRAHGHVAVGPTAALLHGLDGIDPRDPTLHLAAPTPGRPRPGYVVHRLGRRETVSLRGIEVTTVAQTVADVLRTEDRMTAVSVLDSALHQDRLPTGPDGPEAPEGPAAVEAPAAVETLLRRLPCARRARKLLAEGDRCAESPLETRSRLVCTDAGMPPETLQWPLPDPTTGTRYRIDLGWPSKGVGVEADGRGIHGAPDALYADRRRQNALLAAHPRLVLLRFTWRDAIDPDRFLATLRHALARH